MQDISLVAYFQGLMLGFSLIIAIGAQNAFVLRQGLRNQHVLPICIACSFSDALLILAGVSGFQVILTSLPGLVPVVRWLGALFLFVYGLRCFWSVLKNTEALDPASQAPTKLWPALITCLAITWLNPHVYLDTVFLIGSISTGFPGEESYFAMGAMSASFIFFFLLGYGARLLRPFFQKRRSWQFLDAMIGLTMWAIAASLLI